MTGPHRTTLLKTRKNLLDQAEYQEGRASRWPPDTASGEEADSWRQTRIAELRDFARRCRAAAACFELPAEDLPRETCPAHMQPEPCPTCAAYKAAGL